MKLKCDEPLSNVAFIFNLRRHTAVDNEWTGDAADAHVTVGRCRLTVSKYELKARLVSALETKM